MNISLDQRFQFFHISCRFFQKSCQYRVVYLLCHSDFFRIDIHNCLQIYHHIRQNLDIAGLILSLYPYKRSTTVLDRICNLSCDQSSFFCNNLSCQLIHNILCHFLPFDTVFQCQFFVEFVTSDFCKIITSRIKEHACNQTFCTVHCKRLSRTDLLI